MLLHALASTVAHGESHVEILVNLGFHAQYQLQPAGIALHVIVGDGYASVSPIRIHQIGRLHIVGERRESVS